MTIDGLGSVEPAGKYNKPGKIQKTVKSSLADSVSVSREARRLASLQRNADLVKSSPDIRSDRVEEVKAMLRDPDYINRKVIEGVADSIMDVFGLS